MKGIKCETCVVVLCERVEYKSTKRDFSVRLMTFVRMHGNLVKCLRNKSRKYFFLSQSPIKTNFSFDSLVSSLFCIKFIIFDFVLCSTAFSTHQLHKCFMYIIHTLLRWMSRKFTFLCLSVSLISSFVRQGEFLLNREEYYIYFLNTARYFILSLGKRSTWETGSFSFNIFSTTMITMLCYLTPPPSWLLSYSLASLCTNYHKQF